MRSLVYLSSFLVVSALVAQPAASSLPPSRLPHPPRADWGAPLVTVSQSGTTWTIAGRKNTLTLNTTDLSMTVIAGPAIWSMVASRAQDIELREHLGTVGTEAGVDWTVPYTDYSSPLGPGKAGIPVPLFSLVYHDAVMTPYSPTGGEARMNRDDRPNWLYGMINGGPPRVSLAAILPDENASEELKQSARRTREILQQMTTLHKRVALLAMTNHEFLEADYKRERATYADGTTVTVDWSAKTVEVTPPR